MNPDELAAALVATLNSSGSLDRRTLETKAANTLADLLDEWSLTESKVGSIIQTALDEYVPDTIALNEAQQLAVIDNVVDYVDIWAQSTEQQIAQTKEVIQNLLTAWELSEITDEVVSDIAGSVISLIDEQKLVNDQKAEQVAEQVVNEVIESWESENLELTPAQEQALVQAVTENLTPVEYVGPGQGGGNQSIGSLLIAGSIGAAISAVVLSLTRSGSISTTEQPQVVAEIIGQMMDSGDIDEAQQEQGMVSAIIAALVSSGQLSGVDSIEQIQSIMVTPAPPAQPITNTDFKWEDVREALTVEITEADRRIGTQPTNEDFRYNPKDIFTITYRDHKNVQKTFTFDLLPAVEARGSGIPGGSDVPEVKPGLLRVVETRHKNIIVPGAAPVQQSIGLKSTIINLVGMFSGLETSTVGTSPAIPGRSQENDVFLAESGPNGVYKPEPPSKAPGTADAFYREVVSPMTEVKVYVQVSNGNEGVTKLTYYGVIIRFKDYYARENRVYYVIDLLLTRYPIQGSGG
jgi:hypothetical protein